MRFSYENIHFRIAALSANDVHDPCSGEEKRQAFRELADEKFLVLPCEIAARAGTVPGWYVEV